MDYMAHNIDKRLDPCLLMPGVKSIVCVALNYAPAERMPEGELQFAAYALGQDYHDIMKSRLHALAARLNITAYRAFCDTAPVLERYWAAQAGLYYHYGIRKHALPKKMFGVFRQHVTEPLLPIFRGFDDFFYMPHSRHTEIRREDIVADDRLKLIAESDESGASIVMARGGREFFITGHLEYSPDTLDKEYRRDMGKRDDVEMPVNYYKDDNPDNAPLVRWRAHANLFFNNWINYYVYQETPYDIDKIE